MLKADTEAIGKSAGEHARLRAEAALLAAEQANGGKATEDQTAKFKEQIKRRKKTQPRSKRQRLRAKSSGKVPRCL
jgi:hypothetical protein